MILVSGQDQEFLNETHCNYFTLIYPTFFRFIYIISRLGKKGRKSQMRISDTAGRVGLTIADKSNLVDSRECRGNEKRREKNLEFYYLISLTAR